MAPLFDRILDSIHLLNTVITLKMRSHQPKHWISRMLSHEWNELEKLILRAQYLEFKLKQSSGNIGLSDGLQSELAAVLRQRDELFAYITTRVAVEAAANETHPGVSPPAV